MAMEARQETEVTNVTCVTKPSFHKLRKGLIRLILIADFPGSVYTIMRIFMGGLKETVVEQDVRKLLAPFGTVKSVDMRYSEPGKGIRMHRGFAYVEVEMTTESWSRCRSAYSKTKWFGSQKLILEVAKPDDRASNKGEDSLNNGDGVQTLKRKRPLIRHNLRNPVDFKDKFQGRVHTKFDGADEEEESCGNSASCSSTSESEVSSESEESCSIQVPSQASVNFSIDLGSYLTSSLPTKPHSIPLPDKASWLAGRSEFRRDFKQQIKAAKRKNRIFVK